MILQSISDRPGGVSHHSSHITSREIPASYAPVILLLAADYAYTGGAFKDLKLVENDILHDICHFLLPQADTGITQSAGKSLSDV